MDTNFKGCITELKVMLHLLELGYNVSQPLLQHSKYDCVVDVNNKLYRIQIKTSRQECQKSFKFNCKSVTTTGNKTVTTKYSKNEIDFFATEWNGTFYLIPVEECSVEKRLWLEKPTNKNSAFAENYIMEEVLKQL